MNLLNEDNVVHIFFNKLGDIIISNLLFLLCCIPVITIGPALTALYHCTLRMVKGNINGVVKTFFRAFKENFKQSLIVWICVLAAGFILITDIRFLMYMGASPVASALFYMTGGAIGVVLIFVLYIFPVIAAFANDLRTHVKNSFLFAFMHFFKTVLIALVTILPMVITYTDYKLLPLYAFCWFFFGFSLVAFINSFMFYKMFCPYLPPEEDIDDEKGL